jgi:hypothetical protein
MPTKVVNMRDLARELGAYSEGHIEVLKESTLNGIARSIPDLVRASPVDTGLYAQSWGFTKTEFGAVLGNTAPYAPIIEYGARPFTPPIKPLLEWAKRVLQDPSQPPDYSPQVRNLAYGVQKKIAAIGMKPRRVMENMIPAIIENIKAEYMSRA